MDKYLVTGKVKLEEVREFTKEIEAKSENDAKEKVYALFGSQNGLRRERIFIDKITKQ